MRVVARKQGEAFRIGRDIKVNVLAVRGSRVKLSFEVPAGTAVCRQEIVFELSAAARSALTDRTEHPP